MMYSFVFVEERNDLKLKITHQTHSKFSANHVVLQIVCFKFKQNEYDVMLENDRLFKQSISVFCKKMVIPIFSFDESKTLN